MQSVSMLHDSRINSMNHLVELTVQEYIDLAKDIIHKNDFQRKRVSSAKSVYSLLKADLKRGCVIPPIVLALTSSPIADSAQESFENFVLRNKEHLVILDGLQRTYTLIDLLKDLESSGDEESLQAVKNLKIRTEFYVGLNRLGILYRMLTLNTGQTPMSLRQQIEILYLDYSQIAINGVELIREVEGRFATALRQYNFREIIEGFNSYLDRDELPIERADLLENIKSLEKLALENQEAEIFEEYVRAWDAFICKVNSLSANIEVTQEYIDEFGTPFGKTLVQIFKKPQAMSGFGAAIGKLKDFGKVQGFEDIVQHVNNLIILNPNEVLESINDKLSWIKSNTKKIGNAQRSYFHYFFRDLFNSENESFCNLATSAESALNKYQSQNM